VWRIPWLDAGSVYQLGEASLLAYWWVSGRHCVSVGGGVGVGFGLHRIGAS